MESLRLLAAVLSITKLAGFVSFGSLEGSSTISTCNNKFLTFLIKIMIKDIFMMFSSLILIVHLVRSQCLATLSCSIFWEMPQ